MGARAKQKPRAKQKQRASRKKAEASAEGAVETLSNQELLSKITALEGDDSADEGADDDE